MLVILCNPGNDLRAGSERPTMLLLDSLKGSLSRKPEEFMRGYFSTFLLLCTMFCYIYIDYKNTFLN